MPTAHNIVSILSNIKRLFGQWIVTWYENPASPQHALLSANCLGDSEG